MFKLFWIFSPLNTEQDRPNLCQELCSISGGLGELKDNQSRKQSWIQFESRTRHTLFTNINNWNLRKNKGRFFAKWFRLRERGREREQGASGGRRWKVWALLTRPAPGLFLPPDTSRTFSFAHWRARGSLPSTCSLITSSTLTVVPPLDTPYYAPAIWPVGSLQDKSYRHFNTVIIIMNNWTKIYYTNLSIHSEYNIQINKIVKTEIIIKLSVL